MPIKKATVVAKKVGFEQIEEVPEEIPRDQWKRPLIVPKAGGEPKAYTRASTLGKTIEDDFHLNKWKMRCVAFGLSRSPGLLALAASVESNEGDDRKQLDEIVDKAHEAARGDESANIGTALHKLSERRDAGEDLSYLPAILLEAIESYSVQMKTFKVLATETFVACDQVETAGTFDRVVQLLVDLKFYHPIKKDVIIPAGTVLVLDLKTGKYASAKYWGPTYGVQQAVYQSGDPYTAKGRLTWEELLGPGLVPSSEWAVLLHVPSDSPKDAGLIIVDLDLGRAMAELCTEVRTAVKTKGLLCEANPVDPADNPAELASEGEFDPEGQSVQLLVQIENAEHEDVLGALWDQYQAVWTDEHTWAAQVRIKHLAAAAVPAPRQAEPTQVVKTKLIAELRQARDEEVLNALWEAHQDIWNDDATRMTKARLAELKAVAP